LSTVTVALHPQPYPGEPDVVRWVTAPLPFTGQVSAVPPDLTALLDDGTLASVYVEPSAVLTRLGPGHTWTHDGPRVRTALHVALADPDGWTPSSDGPSDDAAVADLARAVIDEVTGPYARSHGGTVTLVGVHAGLVTVRLGGSCHGCPAARFTLHLRLERDLRLRYPSLRGVVS
jgi:Fe-S cluster biogenesis protein NfuA